MACSAKEIFKIVHSETPFPAFLRLGWSSLKSSLKGKIVKKKPLPHIGIKVPDVECTTEQYIWPLASNENPARVYICSEIRLCVLKASVVTCQSTPSIDLQLTP